MSHKFSQPLKAVFVLMAVAIVLFIVSGATTARAFVMSTQPDNSTAHGVGFLGIVPSDGDVTRLDITATGTPRSFQMIIDERGQTACWYMYFIQTNPQGQSVSWLPHDSVNGSSIYCSDGTNGQKTINLSLDDLRNVDSSPTTTPVWDMTNSYKFQFQRNSGDGTQMQIYGSAGATSTWRAYHVLSSDPVTVESATSTRIWATVPTNNSVYPNDQAIDIEVFYYVSEEDYNELGVGGSIHGATQVFPLNQHAEINGLWNMSFEITDWGYGSATGTLPVDVIINNRDYMMNVQISGANYWNLLGDPFRFISGVSTTTYFTVGSTTNAGNVDTWVASTTQAFRNTPTAYDQINDACNPLAGSDFDVAICIYSVIVPPPSILQDDVDRLKQQFLTIAPWGYVTRFATILGTTASSSLPTISYTFGSSVPVLDGVDISFDPFGAIQESGNLLTSAVSDTDDPKTIWEIMETPINTLVYLGLLFLIINDLLHLGLHHHKNNKDIA